VLNIKAVLRTIAAERAIFLIVNIVFSFVMSRGGCAQHDEKLETRSMAPVFQPFPNTDPGLAGETGVSGDCGIVYGSDGLNVGVGVVGASFKIGAWNPWLV
jgi:hypothetical protein